MPSFLVDEIHQDKVPRNERPIRSQLLTRPSPAGWHIESLREGEIL